jgi:carbon storage regulator CsrA
VTRLTNGNWLFFIAKDIAAVWFSGGETSRRSAVMLVLSRKIGEKLVIGDNITVVVSRVAGNRVTLGIEAPTDVRIVRGELHTDFHEEPATARAGGGYFDSADHATDTVPRLAK